MPVIAALLAAVRARLADERGMTMVTVMGVLMVGGLLTVAAVAAPNGDTKLSRYDQDYKDAYAAAEAGIAEYVMHLSQDNAYWSKCTNVPMPNAVNQRWNGAGSDPRRWRPVSGTSNRNLYTIELLPANGASQCSTTDAQGTMIDNTSRMFAIRATGCANSRSSTACTSGVKRSIVVYFKRRNFLDFLYFTDLETADPTWYELDVGGRPTNPNIVQWGSDNCAQTYWRDGRGSLRYNGQIFMNGSWQSFTDSCTEIQFAPGDVIAGPFHTNDSIMVCGSPNFGRNAQDRIEVSGPAPGYRSTSGCSADPDFIGTWAPNSPILTLPPSDASLKRIVDPNYLFTGRTTIRLNGGNLVVTNAARGLTNATMPFPSNGVVFVQDGGCGQGYRPLDPYNAPAGCADVYVRGSYSSDLTIASEKDIIIDEDITRTGDRMLGLIANNFVRVYHPVTRDSSNPTQCTNASGGPGSIQIDAAILALQHSFTVDNYYCGSALGTLTVNGAIAQKFRGPVGRGGSTIANGYLKNYNYDDRLRFRSPPHFLDPVQTSWRIARQTEQSPAR